MTSIVKIKEQLGTNFTFVTNCSLVELYETDSS
jgi:hypothetical protein